MDEEARDARPNERGVVAATAAVAELAKRVERHYGCPQDVEWAIDPLRPEDDNVVLLQSRPETVWSRRRTEVDAVARDTFSSIVHHLLHPAGTPVAHQH